KRTGRPRLVSLFFPVRVEVCAYPQLCVFLRDDFGSGLSKCFIRSGVLQMPISIENCCNPLSVELFVKKFEQVCRSRRKAAVDEQQAFGLAEDYDVAARAGDKRKVICQWRCG